MLQFNEIIEWNMTNQEINQFNKYREELEKKDSKEKKKPSESNTN